MDEAMEIRINWTASQWRQFFGQADITPLAELTSMVADKIALHVVDQRLEALGRGLWGPEGDTDRAIGSSAKAIASPRRG